jgi:RNA polymerase sigma-70 factor (ECF subfamily)
MLSEQELYKQCVSGSRTAQKELFDRFSPRMLGVCYRYTRSMQEAEDVLQDVFIKVFQNLQFFKGDGSLEGWVRKIAINTSLNHLKKNKHISEELEIDSARKVEGPVDLSIENYDSKLIWQTIENLPDGYRVILNMFAVEGYSHKEIAEQLEIAEGTSRSQFLRAKAHLKKMLEKQNIPIHY